MGGNMSWPRFRGRNRLNFRPNYYSGAVDAPPVDSGQSINEYTTDPQLSGSYLSGEIDRMVYGWWLNEHFQKAVAQEIGLTVEQVDAVMQAMLTWDIIWPKQEGGYNHNTNTNSYWGKVF